MSGFRGASLDEDEDVFLSCEEDDCGTAAEGAAVSVNGAPREDVPGFRCSSCQRVTIMDIVHTGIIIRPVSLIPSHELPQESSIQKDSTKNTPPADDSDTSAVELIQERPPAQSVQRLSLECSVKEGQSDKWTQKESLKQEIPPVDSTHHTPLEKETPSAQSLLETSSELTLLETSSVQATLETSLLSVVETASVPQALESTTPLQSAVETASVPQALESTTPLQSAVETASVPQALESTTPLQSAVEKSILQALENTTPVQSAVETAPVPQALESSAPVQSVVETASVPQALKGTTPVQSALVVQENVVQETPSVKSTQDTKSVESTQNTISVKSTQDTISVESTQNISVKSTQDTSSVKPTQDTISVESTQETTSVKSTQDTPSVELTQDTSSVKPTQDTISVESTQETTSVKSTQDTPSVELTQDTTSVKSTQKTTSVKSIQDTSVESTQNTTVVHATPEIPLKQPSKVTLLQQSTPLVQSSLETPSVQSIPTLKSPHEALVVQPSPETVASTQGNPPIPLTQQTPSVKETRTVQSMKGNQPLQFKNETPQKELTQIIPLVNSIQEIPSKPTQEVPLVEKIPPEESHNKLQIQSSKETPTVQIKPDRPLVQSRQETAKKKSNQNLSPLQSTQDTTPVQSTQDTTPVQSKQDTTPLQSTQDITPIQSTQDTIPVQSTQDTTPIQSTQDTTEVQSTQDTTPLQSTQDTTPLQSTQDTTPIQLTHDTQVKSTQEIPPMQSTQDILPSEVEKDTSLKFSQDTLTLESSDVTSSKTPLSQESTHIAPLNISAQDTMSNLSTPVINSSTQNSYNNASTQVKTNLDKQSKLNYSTDTERNNIGSVDANAQVIEAFDVKDVMDVRTVNLNTKNKQSFEYFTNMDNFFTNEAKIVDSVCDGACNVDAEKDEVTDHEFFVDGCDSDDNIGDGDNADSIAEDDNADNIAEDNNGDNIADVEIDNYISDYGPDDNIVYDDNDGGWIDDEGDIEATVDDDEEVDEDRLDNEQEIFDLDDLNNEGTLGFIDSHVYHRVDLIGRSPKQKRLFGLKPLILSEVAEETDADYDTNTLALDLSQREVNPDLYLMSGNVRQSWVQPNLKVPFPVVKSCVVDDGQLATDSEDDKWSVDSLCEESILSQSISSMEGCVETRTMKMPSPPHNDKLDDSLDYSASLDRESFDGMFADTDSGYIHSISMMDSLSSLQFSEMDYHSMNTPQTTNLNDLSSNKRNSSLLQNSCSLNHPEVSIRPLQCNLGPLQFSGPYCPQDNQLTPKADVSASTTNLSAPYHTDIDNTPTPNADYVPFGQLDVSATQTIGGGLNVSSPSYPGGQKSSLVVHKEDIVDGKGSNYSISSKIRLDTERIDPVQAKLRSSLSWLLSKVYGCNVPKELQDPFYQTAEGQVVLRPVMVNYMSSSELYCQACCNMFPETHTQWKGHWSIIQVLSRKGIYISDETSVTETVLVQTAPIKLKAHLALIDAIMRAYINEVASVEKVVIAVKRVVTFPASSELPMTSDEALTFWINKICTVLRNPEAEGGSIAGGETAHKGRAVSKPVVQRDSIYVPLLEDLMRDIGDGCSVAAVIAYYRPHLVNIQELCLKDNIGIADSLFNLRQIGEFCRNHLPWKAFHLTYEDLLYTHESMKVNILTFLADLFYCFEGPGSPESEASSAAAALTAAKEKIDAMPAAGKKSSLSTVPISAVTKKSFQRLPFEDTASNLGMARSNVISPTTHQPLLSRRSGGKRGVPGQDETRQSPPLNRRGRRTVSLSSPQDRETIHKSVLAWQDDQKITTQRSQSQSRGNLLNNASIDSSLNQSMNAENLSLDLSELDNLDTPRMKGGLDPNHPDYMELESVTSGQPSRFASPQQGTTDRNTSRTTPIPSDNRLEPLTPAVLRPTKEKDTNFTKAEERGDKSHRRRQVPSPCLRPPSQQSSAYQQNSARSSTDDLTTVSISSSSEETTVSSLPSGESPSPRMNAAAQLGNKPYEAFTIGPDIDTSPLNSARSNAISTAGSYTVNNRVTAQAARAAGIPVVADSADLNHNMADNRSREGSVASSGEYSDHESQKIHQDHKVRESGSTPATPSSVNINNNSTIKPAVVVVTGKFGSAEESKMFIKMSPSQTTNFAELKRMKDSLGYKIDKVDNSALIYMQSGTQGGPYDKLGVGQGLKSTFNQLTSNQSETAKTLQLEVTSPSPVPNNASNAESNGAPEPGPSDLQQLRLKLEQKRKEIERKKHQQEAQQKKIRQRLGKAAFMRVVSKHHEGGEEDESLEEAESSEQGDSVALSTQAQLQARLGYPVQRLPLGQTARTQPLIPAHSLHMAAHQGQTIPPETSAQRFTDWTNISKGNQPALASKTDQQLLMANSCPSDLGSDSHSVKSVNRAFSREGIQQTIDNVKNKWFKSNSDLMSGGQGSEDEVDSYRLHSPNLVGGARREHSQSPVVAGGSKPLPIPGSSPHVHGGASPRPNTEDTDYQEYDSSLDKLNNSLTELQGEIMRLSLQHEQLKAAQSPIAGQPVGFDPRLSDALEAIGSTAVGTSPSTRPIHGIPQQAPYIHAAMVRKQAADTLKSSPQLPSDSLVDCVRSSPGQPVGQSDTSDGFFVAFAEDTPKKPKPKLTTDSQNASPGLKTVQDAQADSLSLTPQKVEEPVEENFPAVGFIYKDEDARTKEQVNEDEMQKKRVKLIEMQRKRKEEQEKRRLEKEAEMAKKMEEKMLKEEEQEKKKAEEKARREVIFQQYLQKKQEDEDQSPVSKPRIKKRDGSSGGKPRPKSMFVKSKAATPEPGAMGGFESGSSSQEDLTGRNNGGRSTPGVMSAMRSTYHFRLPPPSAGIRKAVSCNTLQGSPNGAQGPATYRRPPSPDLYKIKQQRQRGNSQDSGSETGSGSNPGSDYAGPKLFVKPSAKSNRHIIINALSHCCLAGSVNTDMKNKVLDELAKCEANHFLILFRDAGCQYRGLFIFYPETEEAFKIHGVGPKHITNKMCEKFYKYNSGAKSFMEITSTKHLSVSVDAVVLQGTVWKTSKAVVKR
ncbi:calmodulin-regulated spectrin-associated protein 1 [Biomphalaria pfeifferi]|uniref:Calmodulin-regulated spectrin-associated protein 1 n=1 Tax=Biomphalaria pfeifferi TaxID=112525 RepID=A0AAD8BJL3_BIOPF|nr:calmodulin-regulated spectrin-associated protein 1 [Biomphalaria pfeifferi]